jgi:hypothetical protein
MALQADTLLLVTFSGNTPELHALMPHLPQNLPLIALTSHTAPQTAPLLAGRQNGILLPGPIHVPEETSFGVCAPTTSTTVALAIGDALAVATSRRLHRSPREVFKTNHPGGAIGKKEEAQLIPTIAGLVTSLECMHNVCTPRRKGESARIPEEIRILDVLHAAVRSPGGWVRIGDAVVSPRKIAAYEGDTRVFVKNHLELLSESDRWITVLSDSTIEDVRNWVLKTRSEGKDFLDAGTVIGSVLDGQVVGLLEVEELFPDLEDA